MTPNNLGKTWSILMMLGAKYDDAGVEGRRQERVRGKERRKQISRRAQKKRYLTEDARKRSEQEREEGREAERGMRASAIASDESVCVERLHITEL
jgi:IS5 family transposase